MSKRVYKIPVPYTTDFESGEKLAFARGMSQVQEALPRLKPALVAKLEKVGPFNPVTFTRADLDGIPDDLWAALAPHLG